MVGLDCSIIMNPRVWEASGHVGGFSDPMVDCRGTKERYRADQLYVFAYVFPAVNHKGEPTEAWLAGLGSIARGSRRAAREEGGQAGQEVRPAGSIRPTIIPYMQLDVADREKVVGPSTDERGTLTEPRSFNLMFKTYVGALEDESNIAYLRPETAQGIFANFKNVVDTGRVKLPFGIAQVGKSFRNEINPRNFTFRSREFEQMEIEFFCRPDEAKEWYAYWRKTRFQWYVDLGLQVRPAAAARPRRRGAGVLLDGHGRHRVRLPVRHQRAGRHRPPGRLRPDPAHEVQRQGPELFRRGTKERFVPHVIEPSAGADRATLAFLCEAYTEDEVGGETRTVLKFHPRIAPIKAADLPAGQTDGMPEKAEAIYRDLRRHFNVFYDEKGAIGRRYRRQDEAGTPFCITVDGQTLTDDTVTFRDRDSCRQWRVPIGRNRPGAPRPARRPGRFRRVPELVRTARYSRAPERRSDPVVSHHASDHHAGRVRPMKPCISQATTMSTPFEADLPAFARGGWQAVELWLTKLETYLEDAHRSTSARAARIQGLKPAAAAGPGGPAAVAGPGTRDPLGSLPAPARRSCRSSESRSWSSRPTSFADPRPTTTARRRRARARRPSWPASFGVRLALEFQKAASFCTSLDTALALIAQCGSNRTLGVCLDLFHYYTGPSKFEDLAYLSPRTWPGSRSAT